MRHGFVADPADAPDPITTRRVLIGNALGRSQPLSLAEHAFAERVFAPLLQGQVFPAEQLKRAVCYASLGHAFLLAEQNQHPTLLNSNKLSEAKALRKLRHPTRRIKLEGFIETAPPI